MSVFLRRAESRVLAVLNGLKRRGLFCLLWFSLFLSSFCLPVFTLVTTRGSETKGHFMIQKHTILFCLSSPCSGDTIGNEMEKITFSVWQRLFMIILMLLSQKTYLALTAWYFRNKRKSSIQM